MLLTDGLLPENFSPAGLARTWPRGVELVTLTGRAGTDWMRPSDAGPLSALTRDVGGVAYTINPARLSRTGPRVCPAGAGWNPFGKPCAPDWNAVARRVSYPGQMTRLSPPSARMNFLLVMKNLPMPITPGV